MWEYPTLIGKSPAGPLLSLSSSLSTDVQAAADCCGRTIHNLEMQRLSRGTKDLTDRSFISIVFVLLDWHNCSLEIVATSPTVQLTKPKLESGKRQGQCQIVIISISHLGLWMSLIPHQGLVLPSYGGDAHAHVLHDSSSYVCLLHPCYVCDVHGALSCGGHHLHHCTHLQRTSYHGPIYSFVPLLHGFYSTWKSG